MIELENISCNLIRIIIKNNYQMLMQLLISKLIDRSICHSINFLLILFFISLEYTREDRPLRRNQDAWTTKYPLAASRTSPITSLRRNYALDCRDCPGQFYRRDEIHYGYFILFLHVNLQVDARIIQISAFSERYRCGGARCYYAKREIS